MSEGPWTKEEAEPITWVADWTDENVNDLVRLLQGAYAPQAPGQPLEPSPDEFAANTTGQATHGGLAVSFLALVLCGLIGLTAFAGVPTVVVLIELGVVIGIALLFTLVIMPRSKQKQRATVADAVRGPEAETVTLSADGIHSENSTKSSSRKWVSTTGFFQAKTGLGIWFEGGGGMIGPVASLPDGVDQTELVRRIELWRGDA